MTATRSETPVVCADRNRWIEQGDEALLRPYEGQMEFDHLSETLEHLHLEENQKY